MSIHERDYVLRMIRRMIEALGRLFGQEQPRPDEARRVLDETGQLVLGPLYRTLRDSDARTASMLVSDPEKRWALAALLLEEAKLAATSGNLPRANVRARTAVEILLDLAAGPGGLSEHARATLDQALPRVDPARLSEARRRTLEGLSSPRR